MADEGKSKKTSAADAVFEALRSQISSGVWKVGDRLPSEGELAERYGVNRLTVRVALQTRSWATRSRRRAPTSRPSACASTSPSTAR